MDETLKALLDSMQRQQEVFQRQFVDLLNAKTAATANQANNTPAIPKFEPFDREREKWRVYLERFNQHFRVYNVTDDAQKRACLLSWVGSSTYDLLTNLFGSEDIASKSYAELTGKLSNHFKDITHVQAARYEFYNCKMKAGQSYADWAAELRGLARDCMFVCANEECNHSYVDNQIRDVIIKDTPHPDIRRQCLLAANPTLEDVLKTADTYIRTTEADKVLKGNHSEVPPAAVNKMTGSYRASYRKKSGGHSKSANTGKYKSCPNCFVKHERKDCPCRDLACKACGKKGHIASVCKSPTKKPSHRGDRSSTHTVEESVCTVDMSVQPPSANAHLVFQRIGKQVWIHTTVNGIPATFQWDTGATCSMIGLEGYRQLGSPTIRPVSTQLKGYGNKPLKVKGECTVDVTVGHLTETNLRLLVVDTPHGTNLFGLDWSDKFGLSERGLQALKDKRSETTHTANDHSPQSPVIQNKIATLSSKYSDVFKPGLGHCTKMKAAIHLKPDARPTFFKPREIPFSRRQAVKEELERLVQQGVLKHVDYSDYAAPIVAVSKPNGKVRICGDFKMLNRQISVDQHPLPKLNELLERLQGGKVFSKIDLADAYLQIELDKDAKNLCVINTPFGLFRYERMCFGLASSPAQFQRCMDSMIANLPGVAAYLDDLIITGKDPDDHWQNLERLLAALQEYGFRIRLEKCDFFKSSVEYLGHIIDKDGKRPSDSAIEAIKQLPVPQNIQELQAFLGKMNYYGSFIHNLADKAAPLYKFLQKDSMFKWTQECDQAFKALKNEVIQATQLAHYDETKPLILATDASQYGIGAALMQMKEGVETPLAHASKTLNDHQKKYSQIEKEALSIIYGVTKFRQYLYGRKFTLVTDHQPLVAIFSPDKQVPVLTAQRLQRWALTLMAYQFDIRYKPTKQHGNADGLSRLPHGPDATFDDQELQDSAEVSHVIQEEVESCLLDSKLIQKETQKDASLQLVIQWVTSGSWPDRLPHDYTHLQPYKSHKESLSVHNNVLLLQRDGHIRVVIPKSLVHQVLDLLHMSHWGIVRMKQLARRYAWWPGINLDIEKSVKSCTSCKEMANDPARQYTSWPETQKPWERIHLDFAGPFKGKMWLVCMDAHSKYPYVAILDIGKTTTQDTIAVLRHIFITEGFPETIVTDNGPQFTAGEFQNFCTNHGIRHMTSAPFHPASNGEAERLVQSLKGSINKTCAGGESVKAALQMFLATYRCLPHPSLNWRTPAEVLHGRQPRNLLSLMNPQGRSEIQQPSSPSPHLFAANSLVYARNYGPGPKWLAGTIIHKLGSNMFKIQTDKGVWRRHINQLQPRLSHGLNDLNTATAPPADTPTVKDQRPPAEQPRYPKRNRRKPDYYDSSRF